MSKNKSTSIALKTNNPSQIVSTEKITPLNLPRSVSAKVSSAIINSMKINPQRLLQEKKPSQKTKKPVLTNNSLPIMRGSIKHVPTKRSKFKVVVRRVERPFNTDFEHQLAWICSSLGFFEPIDKDKNAAGVFKELVLATEDGTTLSSTALAERVGMSRGAVINHLNNLLRSGLVEKSGHFYSARSRSMKRTIEEIEEDIERIFAQLKKTAEEISLVPSEIQFRFNHFSIEF
ncbi:MAG: helix-turn-helix domain-containing protein [Candidatus Diapherotrites archaeon]|nr:helix-turn-helix domain-containing protein [Candidatus Diapherotrites archaeon]